MKFLGYTALALGAIQTTCSAFPLLNEGPQVVLREVSGLFSGLKILSGGSGNGLSWFRDNDDNGKDRMLNKIIRDVSHEDDLVDIDYVKMDPEQPKRSTPIHINALAFVKEHIESAEANIKVKYGFIKLLDRNYDLCEELKTNLNKTCPVDEGPIEVNVDVDVPGFVPPGWFHLEAVAWRSDDEKQIGRILADVKF